MKKLLLILTLPFFISFSTDKAPPAKYYYKDTVNVDIVVREDNDTGIYINQKKNNLYNITTESKTYQVFYNKNFTLLAVELVINKKENSETYKRYNRQGILLESYKQVNHAFVDCYCQFYNNGKAKEKIYYNNKNKMYADSIWYKNGLLYTIYTEFSNSAKKSQDFYSNGKLKYEQFTGSDLAQTSFVIEYDSISGIPSYFMTCDSTNTFFDNDGNQITIGMRLNESIDSVKVIKLKR